MIICQEFPNLHKMCADCLQVSEVLFKAVEPEYFFLKKKRTFTPNVGLFCVQRAGGAIVRNRGHDGKLVVWHSEMFDYLLLVGQEPSTQTAFSSLPRKLWDFRGGLLQ